MMSDFNERFNPFRGLCHEELVEAYTYYSAWNDREATDMVASAYNEDVWMDLRDFGIGTSDHP